MIAEQQVGLMTKSASQADLGAALVTPDTESHS